MYKEIEGDLFESDLPAIGHGCNTAGIMGAGIALAFKSRYPHMYLQYRNQCNAGIFTLDSAFMVWVGEDEQVIFNLATQPDPGPSATLDNIHYAVGSALIACERWNIPSLGIPRIGAGLGGLNWKDVRTKLQDAAEVTSTDLVVVCLPEDGK